MSLLRTCDIYHPEFDFSCTCSNSVRQTHCPRIAPLHKFSDQDKCFNIEPSLEPSLEPKMRHKLSLNAGWHRNFSSPRRRFYKMIRSPFHLTIIFVARQNAASKLHLALVEWFVSVAARL